MTSPTSDEVIPGYRSWAVEEFRLEVEPYYVAVADEVELFRAAWEAKIPVLIKGLVCIGHAQVGQALPEAAGDR